MTHPYPETLAVLTHWLVLLGGPLTTSNPPLDIAASVSPFIRVSTDLLLSIGSIRRLSLLVPEFTGIDLSAVLADVPTPSQLFVDIGTTTVLAAQSPPLIPLQAGADISTLVSDLQDAIRLPAWVGPLLKWSGLITMILGIIAYFVSPSVNNRHRGFTMAATGIVVALIGFAFPTVINLIHHVLSG
ncbi:hypothetical protein EFA46_015455 (plasmid) [Halarchaeum sp. CBA1220]|uniref:hypothetical protein n=1 Tax=Halarchaeum sp. CBA1220 TaxID=1853682 RepID=UPI0011CE11A4|nr:hypothetical protein [Halarchaeum sp. CBA1220]QLC35655.1 hypothetical protein EFA46_015455 [Halarchaeum sp. CBA1220]